MLLHLSCSESFKRFFLIVIEASTVHRSLGNQAFSQITTGKCVLGLDVQNLYSKITCFNSDQPHTERGGVRGMLQLLEK